MFGRRKKNSAQDDDTTTGFFGDETADGDSAAETPDKGPFDLADMDEDREVVASARLDLGSVLVPLPEGGQIQVEMTPAGAPQAVHIVTQFGRITVAAYAAPKSPGQWREVAADLTASLRSDNAETSIEEGPWGRELHGVTSNADLRFIGVDGYRWMVRCVLAGPAGAVSEGSPLVRLGHSILEQTVVDRGSDPHPVRTPLPVVLPEALVQQLAVAQQQQAEQAAAQVDGEPATPASQQTPPQQTSPQQSQNGQRRGASGSAIQQLGN